jgi:hypothetical protein
MPRGGKREGQGRPPGAKNKSTLEKEFQAVVGIRAAVDTGTMPLDVLLARMRGLPLSNGQMVTDAQFAAAQACAPYLHPRLSAALVKDVTPPAPADRDARILELLEKGRGRLLTVEAGIEDADDAE